MSIKEKRLLLFFLHYFLWPANMLLRSLQALFIKDWNKKVSSRTTKNLMELKNKSKDLINKKQSILCHANHSPSIPSISPMSMLCIKVSQRKKGKISTHKKCPTTEKGHGIKLIVVLVHIKQIRKTILKKRISCGLVKLRQPFAGEFIIIWHDRSCLQWITKIFSGWKLHPQYIYIYI